ncbi:hypothetical protein ACIOD1_12940 [Streptomyces sp. NPDC088097]
MDHPFQATISEAELIRRHQEAVAAQQAEQERQNQPTPQEG